MGLGNWWSNQSTTAKTIYVLLGVGAITGIVVLLTNNQYEKKSKTKNIQPKEENPSEIEKKEQDSEQVKDLPNNGEKCGEVIQTFDKDFDYVNCDGVWYIKSKDNPISEHSKGLFTKWTKITTDILIDRLNRRYQS